MLFSLNRQNILWHKVCHDDVIFSNFNYVYDITRVEICVIKYLKIFLLEGIGTNIVSQTEVCANSHIYGIVPQLEDIIWGNTRMFFTDRTEQNYLDLPSGIILEQAKKI